MNKETQKQKICFVFGTRPEIIKLSPVIKECVKRKIDFITVHTGQHYSENMDKIFWEGLQLPKIDYNLEVGSANHGTQTAKMLVGIEDILIDEQPSIVVVQGDTNSVLAGAVAAAKLHIPVAHVEAGLRSFDMSMPEEVNRILAGSVATYHFAPTQGAKENLLREGEDESSIFVVGNTIVDSVNENVVIAAEQSTVLNELFKIDTRYALVTVHRQENADVKENLEQIIEAIKRVSKENDLKIVWPVHPRTKKQLETFGLLKDVKAIDGMHLIEPVGFFDMLRLQKASAVVMTDSGGLQEESCILGVPCVTLRSNTERPETVDVGANILAGNKTADIVAAVKQMLSQDAKQDNPFGDGTSAKQIMDVLSSDKPRVKTRATSEQYA